MTWLQAAKAALSGGGPRLNRKSPWVSGTKYPIWRLIFVLQFAAHSALGSPKSTNNIEVIHAQRRAFSCREPGPSRGIF